MNKASHSAQFPPQLPPWRAWRNALAITVFGCVLFGFGCFVLLGGELPRRMKLYDAAIWLQIGFSTMAAVIFVFIVVRQRRCRSSLAELGWGRPTTRLALALSVILGAAYLTGAYFAARYVLPHTDVTRFTWARLALAPLGVFLAVAEETMMRGLFMTELQRGCVPTWLQILASGFCSALYHSFQNPTLSGFLPSFVLFSLHAGLYVLGKRSLTPVIVAHSIYHIFGEPYLLMMVMATMTY
jgi:membrane protease YdiL (CAAX protease family)